MPDGSTRILLGFADAGGFSGAAGVYSDNTGAIMINVVSETLEISAVLTFLTQGKGGWSAVGPEDSIRYGETFKVEVEFSTMPDDFPVNVIIGWGRMPEELSITLMPVEGMDTLFRSRELQIVYEDNGPVVVVNDDSENISIHP